MHDELARQIKALADESGQTFTSLVEEGCRAVLRERRTQRRKKNEPLPSADLGGPAADTDPEHPNRILADLDDELHPTLTAPDSSRV